MSIMSRGGMSHSRRDGHALAIGFAGGMAIVVTFTLGLCILGCVCHRRYESDQINRRKFVDKSIPSKIYMGHSDRGGVVKLGDGRAESPMGEEAKQEIKEKALTLDIHDPKDDGVCSICLVTYKNRDKISWSTNQDCSHTFHKKCISAWLYNHTECPICREVFLWEEQHENDEEEVVTEPYLGTGDSRDMEAPGTAVKPNALEDEDYVA